MIPNIDPPPPWTPQGWSPNALQQSQSSIVAEMPTIIETLRLANNPASWYVNRLDLTQAQMITLNSAPIPCIPSPGPDKIVVIWGAVLVCEITVVFANNPLYQFRYVGFVQNNMAIGGIGPNVLGRKVAFGLANNNAYVGFAPSDMVTGLAINFFATADLVGAGALQDCSLTVVYSLFDSPIN